MRRRCIPFAVIALVLGCVAAAALCQPAAAASLREETFGLALPIPKGWFVAGAKDALDPREVEFGSAKVQAAARNYKGPQPQAVLKYKEPYPDLNPSVQVQSAAKPIRDMSDSDFLNAMMIGLRSHMNQAKIVTPVSTVVLGGRKAAHGAFEYAFTYQGKTFPVRSEVWVVGDATRALVVIAAARKDEANGGMAELRSVVARASFAAPKTPAPKTSAPKTAAPNPR
ncbi:hypothetical protein [Methylopila sp. M107]|uniref:hypothetical protein n=1 Tax=Methylopila sp. M107 TaxID=1101190 RepID=UPI000373860D|nr:hypothetical protein [Methylopila sp. M107]